MERDFMGAAGNEQQQQRQRAAEDDATRKESAYFGAGGPPPMDWSFATSRAGAAPAVMSFRQSAPREEQQGLAHFSAFDGVQKQQAPRVLTQQRSFGAENHGSPQYTATRGAYGVPPPQQHAVNGAYGGQAPKQQHVVSDAYGGQQQRQHVVNGAYGGHPSQQQHAANGARATPVSSPLNPNNQMFKVQSSPNAAQNGVAAGGPFKQPPFALNNAAVAASRVGVYARNMPKPKMAQLTIFYAGSVNVFNNVSAEKAQELMVLASRGSLPTAPSTVARSPDANLFASWSEKICIRTASNSSGCTWKRPSASEKKSQHPRFHLQSRCYLRCSSVFHLPNRFPACLKPHVSPRALLAPTSTRQCQNLLCLSEVSHRLPIL